MDEVHRAPIERPSNSGSDGRFHELRAEFRAEQPIGGWCTASAVSTAHRAVANGTPFFLSLLDRSTRDRQHSDTPREAERGHENNCCAERDEPTSVEKHYQIPQVQIGFCTYQTHPACWTAPAPIAPLRRCVNTRSRTFAEPCITLAAFEPWAQASDQVSLGNFIFLSRSGCLLYFEAEVSDAVSYPN